MRYVVKKKLPGGGAVAPVTIDHFILFQRFNTRAEVSPKLTLKCFLSREKVTYTFFFNETYINMMKEIFFFQKGRNHRSANDRTRPRIGRSTSTIFFKITEKPQAFN